MEMAEKEPEPLDFQENSGIKNDQLRKEDLELIESRSNIIEKIVECPAISELDREELLADDAVVAVLLGYKPLSMLFSTDKARISINKIQDYYKENPNSDEARVFLTGLRITKESIYNPESFRRLLIQKQESLSGTDFQDIIHEVNPDFELIDQLIDKNIRITDNDQLVGALLDFPPQSTENFKIWTSAENKLDQYLERGKQGMVEDGWTDEEVKIMTHISIPRDIIAEKQILTRHQDQIGLSEDEIEVSLHNKSASDLGIFGYETILFPKPENKFKDEEIKGIKYKTKEAELITDALTKIAKIKSRFPAVPNSRSISNIEDVWRRGNNV